MLGISNSQSLTNPPQPSPPPQPAPQVVVAQIRAQGDQAKAQADVQKAQATEQTKQVELAVQQQNSEADRISDENRASMALAGKVVESHADTAQHAISTVQDQLQHSQTLDQADRHKAADMALGQGNGIVQGGSGDQGLEP